MARINTNIASLISQSNLGRTNADLVTRLQSLGYLPTAGTKIQAQLTHEFVESDDPVVTTS